MIMVKFMKNVEVRRYSIVEYDIRYRIREDTRLKSASDVNLSVFLCGVSPMPMYSILYFPRFERRFSRQHLLPVLEVCRQKDKAPFRHSSQQMPMAMHAHKA